MTRQSLTNTALFLTLILVAARVVANDELLLGLDTLRSQGKADPGHSQVEFNVSAAFALKRGEKIRLALPRGEPYHITYDRTERHPSGARSWIGSAEGSGDDYRVIITRGPRGDVQGTLRTARGIFLLQSTDNQQTLIDLEAAGGRRQSRERDDAIIPPAKQASSNLEPERDTPATSIAATTSSDGASVIDVLVLYTPELVSIHGSDAGARTRIEHLIALSNQAYIDSGIGLSLRLADARLVRYPANYSIDAALDDITYGTHFAVSEVADWRRRSGADLVALVRPYNRVTDPSTCGLAWLGGYGGSNIAYDSAYAFSAINDGSDISGSGYYCDSYTFTHELGHNMGCAHDHAHASVQGAYPYSYGHGVTGSFGTIMSYIDPEVAKFSSPLIQCNGQPCGIADYADNARSINNTRAALAAYLSVRKRSSIAPLLPLILGE